jgi:hypothetical protein
VNFKSAAVVAAMSLGALARADVVIWDESINGDISGDRLNPSFVNLSLGVNTLIASSLTGDREYIRMTIPAGLNLASIVNVTWISEDPIGFIAVQQSATFTEPPTGTNVANLLGWMHFGSGPGTVGQNILAALGQGAGSIGFAPPLPASTYTFWIQQTGPFLATYRLDFVVVPAPGTVALGALALLCAPRRRR